MHKPWKERPALSEGKGMSVWGCVNCFDHPWLLASIDNIPPAEAIHYQQLPSLPSGVTDTNFTGPVA